MNRGEARTAVRSTFEDTAGAPTDTELNTWIDIEHKLLLRKIGEAAPSTMTLVTTPTTLAAGTDQVSLPADFETLIRFERQVGTRWEPVDRSDDLSPHLGYRTFREEGFGTIVVSPIELAPGTYRAVYTWLPSTLTADANLLQVSPGFEDVIIERVAARCRVKLEEDPTPHLQRAEKVWTEQIRALKKRYGRHPDPGLRQVRRW